MSFLKWLTCHLFCLTMQSYGLFAVWPTKTKKNARKWLFCWHKSRIVYAHTSKRPFFCVRTQFWEGSVFCLKIWSYTIYLLYLHSKTYYIYICIDGITCKTSIEALWIYYQLSRITGSRSLRWRARWTWRSRTCTSWFSRATPPSRRCIGWRMRWTSACLNSWGRTDRPTSGLPESGSFHLMRFAEGWWI